MGRAGRAGENCRSYLFCRYVQVFWSISLYNAEGFFQKNQYNAYSVNNITAKKSPHGTIDVQFGGTVRLYRPREAILDGKWKFPEARPMN